MFAWQAAASHDERGSTDEGGDTLLLQFKQTGREFGRWEGQCFLNRFNYDDTWGSVKEFVAGELGVDRYKVNLRFMGRLFSPENTIRAIRLNNGCLIMVELMLHDDDEDLGKPTRNRWQPPGEARSVGWVGKGRPSSNSCHPHIHIYIYTYIYMHE